MSVRHFYFVCKTLLFLPKNYSENSIENFIYGTVSTWNVSFRVWTMIYTLKGTQYMNNLWVIIHLKIGTNQNFEKNLPPKSSKNEKMIIPGLFQFEGVNFWRKPNYFVKTKWLSLRNFFVGVPMLKIGPFYDFFHFPSERGIALMQNID